jgi:hypothetical protein
VLFRAVQPRPILPLRAPGAVFIVSGVVLLALGAIL